MIYTNILPGKFLARPNRFIANIEIEGKEQVCHVKNTGSCKELLLPGAEVFVQKSDNPLRKTAYDLISVYKGNMLVNMDSSAPNKVFGEWIKNGDFFKNVEYVKPECKYKNSRFDFYIEADGKKNFVEVKGVTLENDGVVSFPDAPTDRGVKHLLELVDAHNNGYGAYVFFIIQMENCRYFMPNKIQHPLFAETLKYAVECGVEARALKCMVTPTELIANNFVDIELE